MPFSIPTVEALSGLTVPPAMREREWSVEDIVIFTVGMELASANIDGDNITEIMGALRGASRSVAKVQPVLVASKFGWALCEHKALPSVIGGSDGKTSVVIDLEALDLRIRLEGSVPQKPKLEIVTNV